MTIAQQSAMPQPAGRTREFRRLRPAPSRRPGRTLAKIAALVSLTALGAAIAAGAVGLAFVLLLSHAGA